MRYLYLFIILTVWSFNLQAQQTLWKEVHDVKIRDTRYIIPNNYLLYSLDWDSFLKQSKVAKNNRSPLDITLPMPDGNFKTFTLIETPIFEEELSRKYPGFTSYTGYSNEVKGEMLKLSVSPFGIHAMILAANPTESIFIDPLTLSNSNQIYQVYYRKDFKKSNPQFSCGTEPLFDKEIERQDLNSNNTSSLRSVGDCRLRSYRLAIACTGEYANFHGGSIERVLAAYNNTMTRVNGVYERDAGITMKLIGRTDEIIFLDSNTDPYSNGDGNAMLAQNQKTIDKIIGTENYDIGHVFSTGGGGIAFLDSPCNKSNKAKGVTGNINPIGDPFDIDYVAHEMGHQFGANHTQNNNCNRSTSTAVEPGSASTIMGYAGICTPDVQRNSDGYFHGISLNEIQNYVVRGLGNTCATFIDVPNTKPLLEVVKNEYIIPISTPFALTAIASDIEDNSLTYCWEQIDNRTATMPPRANSVNGPMFRSVSPSSSPTRYFPDLSKQFGVWEVLPSVSRNLNFKCTVRDNHPFNGCTEDLNIVLRSTIEAGPFVVTNPNTSAVSWLVGTQQPVIWDIANTDQAPVNCQVVDIYLSVDGGLSYPHQLASNIPNTGSYEVLVPSLTTNQARIMVKAADNVFFDVSDTNFKIVASFTLTSDSSLKIICNEDVWSTEIILEKVSSISQPIHLSISSPIDGLDYIFSDNDITILPTTVTLTISGINQLEPSDYKIIITATSGPESLSAEINLFKGLTEDKIHLLTPANHEASINPTNILFSWDELKGVIDYNIEVSDSPIFSNIIHNQTTKEDQIRFSLDENKIYFWRIKPNSPCYNLANSQIYSFRTSGSTTELALLLRNETLIVDRGQSATLTEKEINVYGDKPEFIVFTITELPAEGQILKNDIAMNVGDIFRMSEILNGLVSYKHWDGYVTTDTVIVNVLDDASRWLPEVIIPIRIKSEELGLVPLRNKTLTCYGNQDAVVELVGFGGVSPYTYSKDGITYFDSNVFEDLSEGSYTFYIKDDSESIVASDPIIIHTPDAIEVEAQREYYDILVNAFGGTGALSYSINGEDFTNAIQFFDPGNGFYTITVKDIFECVSIDTISIDIPVLNATGEVSVDAKCAGQIISIEAAGSGGIPPYRYSTNIDNFVESTIVKTLIPNPVIYVQDAGGKIAISDTLWTNNPAPIEIDLEVNRLTATIFAKGGTGPFTYSSNDVSYSENNVIEFKDNGLYRVYVRDSVLCTTHKSVQFNVIKNVNVTKRDLSCHDKGDGYIKLANQGGVSPIQYKLNDRDYTSSREWNNLDAGIYTYTVKDSKGDSLSGEVELINPESLELSFLINKDTLEINIAGGTPPYRYSIDDGGLFLDTNIYTELDQPAYDVVVKDKNGCSVSGMAILSAVEEHTVGSILIQPNPAIDELRITGVSPLIIGNIEISSIDGSRVEVPAQQISNEIIMLDISSLPSGLYMLQLRDKNIIRTSKFVKI